MANPETPRSVIVADGLCPNCGRPASVKANKKGHLYVYCVTPADGGCGTGMTSRSDSGDVRIANQFAKKWRKSEYRAAYLDGPAPEPSVSENSVSPEPPVPAPDPEPDPEPEGDGLFS